MTHPLFRSDLHLFARTARPLCLLLSLGAAVGCSSDVPTNASAATAPTPTGAPMTPPTTVATPPVTPPATPPVTPVDNVSGTTPPNMTPVQGTPPVAGMGGEATPAGGAAAPAADDKLAGECPEGFEPSEGANTGFPHENAMRQFVVVPPAETDGLIPVFVSLTGTVESTNQNLGDRGDTRKLAEQGWLVLGPVRACSTGPDDASSSCNGAGRDGWNWLPWNEGAAQGASGEKWYQDVGPDARFLESAVKCLATKWNIDAKRLYVGGISSGGTFSNRLLTFNEGFWAGGMPISGEFYALPDPSVVAQDPTIITDGRCCPVPLPRETDAMSPMIIITLWGGPNDTWPGANYLASTQTFSNYMETQDNVVHIACSSTHGHMWPTINRDAYNTWMAETMASHPKGTPKADFMLKPPPDGYMCKLGRYEDHY
jgi:poly(3-hydroxybutyrate) depolymerase